MGNPLPATQVVRIPQRVAVVALQRVFPCRRMRRPRRVPKTPVPPAVRRAGLLRCPERGTTSESLLRHARDPAPRPVADCTPDRIVGPARSPARRSAIAVWETPPFARDRDVALGALAARRPRCRAIAARHMGTFRCRLTPDASSGNAPLRRRVSAADNSMPSLLPHHPRV